MVAEPRVVSVDETGIELRGTDDQVLDVLFDGRRVWSFWSVRDTDRGRVRGERRVDWPGPLSKYLDGVARVTVRAHVDERELFDDELRFGVRDQRIKVVNPQGNELSIDNSGRLQVTFDTRSSQHVTPLLDSVERVLEALGRAGVEAFPAYGTLLGAVRDGRLIGHDSDADLGYVSRYRHPVDVIRESFRIERRVSEMGYDVLRYSGGGIKVQVPEADGHRRGLDVFSGFLDGDGHLVLMGEIRAPFAREWIYPLGTTTLEGRTLPAPAAPDKLLAATYGPDWRTPDPAFRFETPAATTRRLNDWFRGTTVNLGAWDGFYERRRHRRVPGKPSKLARFVHRHEPEADLVVDLGCGRGADARWLARRGTAALGLDYSTRAYQRAERDAAERGLPVEFSRMNLLTLRDVFARGALVGSAPGRHAVLARHILDALPPRGRHNLWRFLRLALHGGGHAYLEFLVSSAENDPWARRHMLTPLVPAQVHKAAETQGFEIVSSRIIRSRGMGLPRKDRDQFYDERRACRMVVRWPG